MTRADSPSPGDTPHRSRTVGLAEILHTWWPLAGSWVLMGLEIPMVSAVVSRLANPEVNLAAYGAVVYPLSFLVEAPIIMLLAASTAISRDRASYLLLRRFMIIAGASLTTIHALVAFTPLYDVVVGRIIGVPVEVLAPARLGLMITTPWTWSIAVRRFHQGVLIRFGYSRIVVAGTVVRILANVVVLGTGLALGTVPGIAVAATSVCCGVIAEAIFIGIKVQPVLRRDLAAAPRVEPALDFRQLLSFYLPLAATPLIRMATLPVISAALSRMPNALESLAVWPVMSSLVFMLRSVGVAYNEVVVALVDRPGGFVGLRRFTRSLATATTTGLLVVTATPLAQLWFGVVCGLSATLTALAVPALWLALPTPALATIQSWHQGLLLHARRTRAVTEAVSLYLAGMVAVLAAGVAAGSVAGLYVGMAASLVAIVLQTFWLWRRSRPVVREFRRAPGLAAAPLG